MSPAYALRAQSLQASTQARQPAALKYPPMATAPTTRSTSCVRSGSASVTHSNHVNFETTNGASGTSACVTCSTLDVTVLAVAEAEKEAEQVVGAGMCSVSVECGIAKREVSVN